MSANEYKRLKEQDNVLDFETLNTTRNLLEKAGQQELAQHITKIIENGSVSKPSLHNNLDRWTGFYQVTLTDGEIDLVISLLLDKEADALDENYETTAAASFYASMVDRWNNLITQRSGRDASASSA
ncbi:hypothetical protein [Hymenobacter sediminicola]|uniref:Uncharacterized protein n=1 Tax=Hymenobacter sediminicola TaxID=2761579 RepID=A0A7G7W6J9_9BACT|nr:hypothetical protein [Hymenobacter sediminicola]QNH61992.1 hypothetical protein H4317_17900 [Hymenobacter sediminicola]